MMSDFDSAKVAAATVLEHIAGAEKMALAGTYQHSQFVGATLLNELARIKFILQVIQKN